MDITRQEQRLLHILAKGGSIEASRDTRGKLVGVACFTRECWAVERFDITLFRKLRRRAAIASEGGRPYRITRRGLELTRSRPDNR
jgi:uncharacterized protein YjhX (UPF0386 family)